MQTRTANGALRGVQRWRLVPLLAAACATVALAATASPARTPAPTTYRLIPLAPNGFSDDVNAKGQVAFTEFVGAPPAPGSTMAAPYATWAPSAARAP